MDNQLYFKKAVGYHWFAKKRTAAYQQKSRYRGKFHRFAIWWVGVCFLDLLLVVRLSSRLDQQCENRSNQAWSAVKAQFISAIEQPYQRPKRHGTNSGTDMDKYTGRGEQMTDHYLSGARDSPWEKNSIELGKFKEERVCGNIIIYSILQKILKRFLKGDFEKSSAMPRALLERH